MDSAYEPGGGLLGPDGPLNWSIEDIWGPDERASRHPQSADTAAGAEESADKAAPPATTESHWNGTLQQDRPHREANPGGTESRTTDGPVESTQSPAFHSFAPPRRSDFFGRQHPSGRSKTADASSSSAEDGAGAFGAAGTDSADHLDTDDPGPATRRTTGPTHPIAVEDDVDTAADNASGRNSGNANKAHGNRATPMPYAPYHPETQAAPEIQTTLKPQTAQVTLEPQSTRTTRTAQSATPAPQETIPLPEDPDASSAGSRKRRLAVLLATGGVTVVTAVALIASGVFSHEKPSRDSAMPGTDTETSVPDQVNTDPSAPAPGAKAPHPYRPPSAPATTAREPWHTPAASASAPPASASPSAGVTGPEGATPSAPTPPVLHPGDKGKEVKELQLRLRQLLLYLGIADGEFDSTVETAVGNFQQSRGIKTDEPGVYGPATRKQLESETMQP